jgi:type IV pilus assembly protein PilB
MAKQLLGEMLLEAGIITKEQLEDALRDQKKEKEDTRKKEKRRIGHILTDLGYATNEQIGPLLEKQAGFPYANLEKIVIEGEVAKLAAAELCRRYQFIPFAKENGTLKIAIANPQDLPALEDIKFVTGHNLKIMIAPEKAILNSLDQHYGLPDTMKDIAGTISAQEIEIAGEGELTLAKLQAMAEDAPVIKIVNLILMQSVDEGASDIHIEPYEREVRLRYRVDGILHQVSSPPKRTHPAIVSRIKIMAELDIAERRLPQDGRIMIRIREKEIDLRVSIIPTVFGEKVVMRILDRSSLKLEMVALGFEKEDLEKFKEGIQRPYGMLLVTGPTGSGKTTTLYTALEEINTIDKNIMTIEEPVEYQLEGLNQMQVNPEIGLTFATSLRHFLRQDPDIIMVGEIRDYETAEIAIRAALTGHLVLSTLHTNDATSAVTRLVDMGVEPFLVTSSVHMVQAQRLVRKICEKCKEETDPPSELVERAKPMDEDFAEGKVKFYKGKGCTNCGDTGYKGRLALFEVVGLNDKIKELILAKAPPHQIRRVAIESGMTTLAQSGLYKVKKGITTLEEVFRVAFEEIGG